MERNFEICKDLSREVYNDNMPNVIDDWQIISPMEFHGSVKSSKRSKINVFKSANFACAAFKKGDEIIIAYRGTDDIIDIITDSHFIAKKIPPSTKKAKEFYIKVKEKFPNHQIYVTGHSLGGAYAQIVAARAIRDGELCNAITFNAPGFGYVLTSQERKKYKSKLQKYINNYVIMNDFIGNFREHAGSTYYMQPYPLDVPDPEKRKAKISPHSAITSYSEQINGKIIPCPEGWNSKCAWALWIYDKNPVSSAEKELQKLLDAKTNCNYLKKAIDIIEKLKTENKFVLLNTFNYRCRRKNFQLKVG
ncbi:MAG: DUF2974 domain-containing protein [Heliobacteriaceae bacterium]|nr:DUF2974 domain-containing protein [Heliobacteriaceae bacterium]